MINQNLKLDPLGCAILLTIALHFTFVPVGESGQINLVTFYPSPVGIYDRLDLTPSTSLPTPCNIGSLSTDPLTGKVIYCSEDTSTPGVGAWGAFSSLWTQNGNYVFADSTISNKSTFVGIGTSAPQSRLTLDNDGGILAIGTLGNGQTISNFSMPTGNPIIHRLIWYPRRAIFRSMTLSTDLTVTDDVNMGDYSVAMGADNKASQTASFVGGGSTNQVLGVHSAIIGGQTNSISGAHSIITGGHDNTIYGNFSTITGSNGVTHDDYTSIGGGTGNSVNGQAATIIGGFLSSSRDSTAGKYSTIVGAAASLALAQYSFIGGGWTNQVGDETLNGAPYSSIGGGQTNIIYDDHATIVGGGDHTIGDAVSGGGSYGTVAGGALSTLTGNWATVTGGSGGHKAYSIFATILGGWTNTVGTVGSNGGSSSTIAGNWKNTASSTASCSVVSGYNNVTNATYSWAGGRFMTLSNAANRSFVWGYSGTALSTTQANSFIIANQKVGIGETAPSAVLSISGNGTDHYLAITSSSGQGITAGNILMIKNNGYLGIGKSDPQYPLEFGNGAFLTNVGVFTNASSRTLKENIQPVDTQQAIDAALKLNPVIYNYKVAKDEHHVGFIAEDVPDFVASKGRKSVSDMNITAVLTAVVKEQKADLAEQDKIISDLKAKINALNTQSETMVSPSTALRVEP